MAVIDAQFLEFCGMKVRALFSHHLPPSVKSFGPPGEHRRKVPSQSLAFPRKTFQQYIRTLQFRRHMPLHISVYKFADGRHFVTSHGVE